MSLVPGSRLGSYEVVALIGAGGMGEVYRARDLKLDRDVALKVLPAAVANDAERLARFEREAKTLAAVNHAHIAQVFGLEDAAGVSGATGRAIVMEFVDGEDLAQVIAKGAIAPVEALAMAYQIAEALEAAHEQGIVHRDLKPANVRVRSDGSIKVLDFGLAKAIDPAGLSAPASLAPTITTPAMTNAGVVLGTAAYMSPEQAKAKFIDRRTDIWAFGAVLFEMLTATRAFAGEDVTDTIVALISKQPDWARLPADTPLPVRTLLQRCLEKDARRRLRDIGEARILIGDVINGKADTGAVPATVLSPTQPIWRRALPVVAAALIMSIVGAAAWSQWRPDPPAAMVARLAVPLPDSWRFVRAGNRMLAFSPDGSKLVYIGNGQLYVRPIGGFESTVIAGSANSDPTDPFFSPDGQWVGFFSVAGAALKKIAVNGGTPVTLTTFPVPSPNAFQGGEWIGDEILYAVVGKGIVKVSANGGEPEVVVPVSPPALVFGPQRLPGGGIMFALAADETNDRWDKAEIVVVHPSTGQRKTILRGGGAPRYLPSGHLAYVVGGTVMVAPFDAQNVEVTGEAVEMLRDVRRTNYFVSGAAQYAVSSAGHVAFIPGAVPDSTRRSLFLLDRGGDVRLLDVPPGQYEHPRISPDGKQFVVSMSEMAGQPNVWVADLTVKPALRRLNFGGDGRYPIWSRDGRHVLYVSDRGGERAIYRQAADGGGAPERVFAHQALRKVEEFHPDGRTLLVSMNTNDVDIGTVASDAVYRPLIERRGIQLGATFSPDGRWFSYSSSDGGLTQLFVEPFPPSRANYQITTDTGGNSIWSPDGRRLLFQAGLGMSEVDQLVAVNLRMEPGFSFEAPVALESAGAILGPDRNFDITPDGTQLLLMRPAEASANAKPLRQQINVVLNFMEELKQRAPMPR